MSRLRKPFFHLDEVLARWDMTERDVTAFVLSDELTLSATVAGLRIQYGYLEDAGDGEDCHIPEGHRYVIGTVDLARDDAWHVLREGTWTITSLKAPLGTYQHIRDDAIDNRHLVHRDDLVICRAEIERFEAEQQIAPEPDTSMRRGAPTRYDWDGFWIELCRIIHDEGVPNTQSRVGSRRGPGFE